MIGDAVAAGKRGSTTKAGPTYKAKNSEGKSFKHVAIGHESDSGSKHKEVSHTARRSTKGMRPGTGKGAGTNQSPQPYRVKNSAGRGHKIVPPKANGRDSGLDDAYSKVAAWVAGKSGSYK